MRQLSADRDPELRAQAARWAGNLGFDPDDVLPKLLRFYTEHGIVPIGRYGTWDYLSMGDAMHHGRQAARWILEN